MKNLNDLTGPNTAELAAIELEWPLIAAEMDVVDAEICILTAPNGPTELDWRRLRRADNARLKALRELLDLTASTVPAPFVLKAVA